MTDAQDYFNRRRMWRSSWAASHSILPGRESQFGKERFDAGWSERERLKRSVSATVEVAISVDVDADLLLENSVARATLPASPKVTDTRQSAWAHLALTRLSKTAPNGRTIFQGLRASPDRRDSLCEEGTGKDWAYRSGSPPPPR